MKNIGGQAVIEGVMMKSKRGWSVAVREPGGTIAVKSEPIGELPKFLSLPIIRGVVALYHALSIGIRALEFSASAASEEDGQKAPGKLAMTLTIIFSFALGAGLFIALPLYAAKLMAMVVPSVSDSTLLFNFTDGIARIAVFLAYILAIGLWGEMRRVFQYHGAEHKVIHAYEEGASLDVESVRDRSTRHPRCGTSFLMIVMLLSIVVFSLIPNSWPFLFKLLSRLVLIPLIAGASYETLKLSALKKDNIAVKALVMPGLALQGLTTREPDDTQIEVAIRALNETIAFEK